MEIRLTDKFISTLNELDDESYRKRQDLRRESLRKIVDLITSGLKLSTDISKEQLKNRYDLSGQKDYKSYKDAIYHCLLKNECGFAPIEELSSINNYKGYYFLERGNGFTNKTGAIVIDNLLEQKDFFEHCSINIDIDNLPDLRIDKSVAPCNAMIYTDNYLFKEKRKTDQFIKFFEHYKRDELSIPFHLTIISVQENAPAQNCLYAETKLGEFKNLCYDIILKVSKFKENRDRLFFMNYVRGNFGHPFDNHKTTFNQFFLGTSSDIFMTYEDYLERLRKLKKVIDDAKDKIGNSKTRYRNMEFENRLLDNLNTIR